MKCSCCGRKKKLLESFENLTQNVDVCVDCSDIMYKICDAKKEKKKDEYKSHVKAIKEFEDKKKSSEDFIKWFKEDFMKRNAYPEEKK